MEFVVVSTQTPLLSPSPPYFRHWMLLPGDSETTRHCCRAPDMVFPTPSPSMAHVHPRPLSLLQSSAASPPWPGGCPLPRAAEKGRPPKHPAALGLMAQLAPSMTQVAASQLVDDGEQLPGNRCQVAKSRRREDILLEA